MEEKINVEKDKVEENLQEILKKINNNLDISEAEKKEIILKINKEFDFNKILEELKQKLPLNNDKYVIFTNSNEQLYYDNGEFFVISASDSTKKRSKITRIQALELYNQYYITHILNPLLKQKSKVADNIHIAEKTVEDVKKIEEVKVEEIKIKEQKVNDDLKKEETKNNSKEKENINQAQIEDRLNALKQKEQEIKKKREDKIR